MRKSGACDDEKRLLYVPRKLLLLAAITGDSLKLRGGQRLGRSVSGILHYAPYDFMLRPAETPKKGIPVPLFNLVYHDCVIEPWMMDRVSKDEDYMLYALLAGGAPYLVRDGAYPNTDGAFDGEKISLEEMTERCRVVTELHEKTALLELVRHECMTVDGSVQKSEFSDGTYVICDFAEQIYEIGYGA